MSEEVIACKGRVIGVGEKPSGPNGNLVETISTLRLTGNNILTLKGGYASSFTDIEVKAELVYGKVYELVFRQEENASKAKVTDGRKFQE